MCRWCVVLDLGTHWMWRSAQSDQICLKMEITITVRDADFYLNAKDSADRTTFLLLRCFRSVPCSRSHRKGCGRRNFEQWFLWYLEKREQMSYGIESRCSTTNSSTCQSFVIWLRTKLKPSGSSVEQYYRCMWSNYYSAILEWSALVDGDVNWMVGQALTDSYISARLNACPTGAGRTRRTMTVFALVTWKGLLNNNW